MRFASFIDLEELLERDLKRFIASTEGKFFGCQRRRLEHIVRDLATIVLIEVADHAREMLTRL